MSEISKKLQQSYDELPYPSAPFVASSPLKLEAIATMLGMTPPQTSNARVLEIGCSYGGNLIPFALSNPNAKVLGIDLSGEQIRRGSEIVKQVGIENLELKQLDICELNAQDLSAYGKFDYIICHGVFSWVPEHVRDAIIKVIKDFLSPQGVAYISYNVYPGWHTKDILKNLMKFASKNSDSLSEKSAKTRQALEIYKRYLLERDNSAIPTDLLLNHINRILLKDDFYVIHEFLEAINNPFYFTDFTAHLDRVGLAYLCDSSMEDIFSPELGNADLSEYMHANFPDRYDQEQFMDFCTHRTFRSSLIVHDSAYEAISTREISPNDIAKLNIVADFKKFENDKWYNPSEIELKGEYAWLYEVFARIYPQSANLTQIIDLIEPQNRLNAYMGFIEILGKGSGAFSLKSFENVGYEVGKTRLKDGTLKLMRYFLNAGAMPEIIFGNELNALLQIKRDEAYIAMKFDGKNTFDKILEDTLKFYKNEGGIIVKGVSLKGEKLRKYALDQIALVEWKMRQAYAFEQF